MELKHEVKNGVLVIKFEGNLLGETVSAQIMDLLKTNIEAGNKKVLLDLKDLKFINSTGLGLMMTTLTKTRHAGGDLAIAHLPEQMKKLLQMTKLESFFPTHADEASALAALSAN